MSKESIRNLNSELICRSWSRLEKYSFEYPRADGRWETHVRDVYDRGDGVVVLLYNPDTLSVILTRQFRLPTFLNGNPSGMSIEACAGALEDRDPVDCAVREVEEETGYRLGRVDKVFEAYMSPGSVTEKLHFYLAEYRSDMKVGPGGGLASEQEYIEVLEIPLERALAMVASGEIRDGKTIMLLQHLRLQQGADTRP